MVTEESDIIPEYDRELIQYGGTDLCVDFACPCGVAGHFDGSQVYALRCVECGAVYKVGARVVVTRDDGYTGTTQELRPDDNT